jgi:hypothetical protein
MERVKKPQWYRQRRVSAGRNAGSALGTGTDQLTALIGA